MNLLDSFIVQNAMWHEIQLLVHLYLVVTCPFFRRGAEGKVTQMQEMKHCQCCRWMSTKEALFFHHCLHTSPSASLGKFRDRGVLLSWDFKLGPSYWDQSSLCSLSLLRWIQTQCCSSEANFPVTSYLYGHVPNSFQQIGPRMIWIFLSCLQQV